VEKHVIWRFLYRVYYFLAHVFFEKPRGLDFMRIYDPQGRPADSLFYQTTSYRQTKKMLKGYLAPQATLLDVGCGKGYFISCAKRFGFSRVDGLERDADLARIARQNMERQKLENVFVFQGSAEDFTDLDRYYVLYLFNPFIGPTMRAFLHNVEASLERRPRPLLVIYNNPVEYRMWEDSQYFELVETRTVNWLYRKISVFYYLHDPESPKKKAAFRNYLEKAMTAEN